MEYKVVNNVNGLPIVATGEFPFVPMGAGDYNYGTGISVFTERDPLLSNIIVLTEEVTE